MTSSQATAVPDLRVTTPEFVRVSGAVVLGGGSLAAARLVNLPGMVTQGLIAGGLTLILVAVLLVIRARVRMRARDMAAQILSGFIEQDATPSFVTDDEGQVHARNGAADTRFAGCETNTLSGTLRMLFANPSAILFRLQSRAGANGSAREDVVTRTGHIRLAVHRLGDQGYLWRVEDIQDRGGQGRGADAIPIPMLTVGRSGAVLFMNEAARALIGERVKTLDRLFMSRSLQPGLVNTILTRQGPVDVTLSEYSSSAGRTELYLLPVETGPTASQANCRGFFKVFETSATRYSQ